MREDKIFYKSLDIDWRDAKEKGSFFDKLFQSSRYRTIRRSFNFRDKTVLDIGCNTGVFTFELAKLGAKISGIDISLPAVKRAHEYSDQLQCRVPFYVADMDSLPFRSDYFDIVIVTAALDHIQDAHRAISEIKRVLKIGGRVFVDVTYKYSLVNMKIVRKIFSARKNDEKINYWEAGFFYSYTPKQIQSLFSEFRKEKLWIGTYLQELYGIFKKI
jgi:ubiquinone/menaquinone biosynthesis C-methylase UbiE